MRALLLVLTACSGSQGEPLQAADSAADIVSSSDAGADDNSTPDAGPVESGTFDVAIVDVVSEPAPVEAAPQDHCVTKTKSYYCGTGFGFYTEISGGDIEPCSYISPSCPSGKPCYAPVVNGTDWGVCP